MFCEKCGNPVGESEKFCAQCGAPLPTMEAEEAAAVEPVPAEAKAAAAVSPAVPQVQEAPPAPAIPVEKQDDSGKTPKKKKKKAPWIIAACVLVAVVVICAVNGDRLGNFFRRSFSSPEKYYQYVEEKTMSALAEASGAYYDTLVMDSMGVNGRSVDMEFALELGENGQELLELLEMADVDLTWLKDLSMGIGYSLKDSLLGYDISFGLNKSDIFSLRSIMDLDGGTMYLQVPELTADYIGVDMAEYAGVDWAESIEAYEEMQAGFETLQKAMPDTREVEKLLQKYLKLALSGVSDVEKSTKTLKVGDVQQKYTELEVTFDGKSLSKILEAVLKEIPKDKDLKKLVVNLLDNLQELDGTWPLSGEDFWDEFVDEVEEMLDNLDELESMDDVLVMKVYVDGTGKIVGRVFELVEDRETYATISILAIEKGSRFGYEFSIQSGSGYGEEMALTGSGRKSGNTLTGDFELEYGGISVLDLKVSDFDRKKLEKGYLNGSITMTFSRQISNLLSTSLSYYGTAYASMLAEMQLTMDFQMEENIGKIVLGIGYGEKDLASLSVSAAIGDGSEVSIPDAKNTVFAEDEEDFENWLKSIDWESFIERLDKADLPDEFIDLMEEVSYLLTVDGGAGLFYDYDDYFGDDYFGDDSFGDDDHGDAPDNGHNEGWGSDNNGDDTYGSGLTDDVNSLEQMLQSDEWQSDLKTWNDSVAAMGITLGTVADGNTLVFEYHLSDDETFYSFGEMEGSLMADAFLGTLEDVDFMEIFETGYGISLDAVQCAVYKADGTEIYRGEMN